MYNLPTIYHSMSDTAQIHSPGIMTTHWPTTIDDAKKMQIALRDRVIKENQFDTVSFVAGVDVGFEEGGSITRAAVAILSYPELAFVEKSIYRLKTTFPYIPGYLSFREAPAILEALSKVLQVPDLILCDGQGLAHPRQFGIACHIGVLTDIPCIGVAKSRLVGTYVEPGQTKGEWSELSQHNTCIGAVLRTRSNVKPLYISIGHKIDLATAMSYVLNCTTRYRLPETTRWAHKLASGK